MKLPTRRALNMKAYDHIYHMQARQPIPIEQSTARNNKVEKFYIITDAALGKDHPHRYYLGHSSWRMGGGAKQSPHQRTQEMALGTWHLAFGTWHVARGTWHLVLGTWHFALGTWHLAPGTWHLALGTWHLALGTWHLALGTWLLALGTLNLALSNCVEHNDAHVKQNMRVWHFVKMHKEGPGASRITLGCLWWLLDITWVVLSQLWWHCVFVVFHHILNFEADYQFFLKWTDRHAPLHKTRYD